MFYWLFYEKLFHVYSPFREFQYYTFRTAMASLTALLLSVLPLGLGLAWALFDVAHLSWHDRLS